MPISKRDRSFQNIVRELDIEKIPVEYVDSVTLILKSGDSIIFEGEDLEEIEEDNVISFIISNNNLSFPINATTKLNTLINLQNSYLLL